MFRRTSTCYPSGRHPCFQRHLAATLGVLISLSGMLWGQAPEPDFSGELPRIAPLEPPAALKSFRLQPGFQIQLVASEPLVSDPVAMAFDEDGRLFVVEMRGYSEDDQLSIGRVRLLSDQDGDGRFDHVTTYVDHLSWPTAVACFDGGVFVAVAPDIRYYKDHDGDGHADEEKTVFTGFGRSNVQGLLNTFKWGLDHRIHGATSSSGATLHRKGDQTAIHLRGRDFAFDPCTASLSPVSGGGQHGMSFNGWGEKFVCSNSDHMQFVCFEDHYLQRNPYLASPPARISIAADGPQADVFRTSPIEPWRIVRTRLRVSGQVPGPIEGGGTAAGYFTGASGITIYRGDAWPHPDYNLAFVCDVGSNLIHRKQLQRDQIAYRATRIDEGDEFVTSTDIWFRPVQLANGPDGGLYVADMYREVIEHPKSLPPAIKKHLDLTSGRDRGRIYRIVPLHFQPGPVPRLSSATAEQLVAYLDHPNGWHRETAARLLYERKWEQAIPLLQQLATTASLPEGRIRALHALAGAAELRPETLLAGLADPHPQVRRHSVQLAEAWVGESSQVRERLVQMTDDVSLQVRYQLAFSLGALEVAERMQPLTELARRDVAHPYLRAAIQSSLASGAGAVLVRLVEDHDWSQAASSQALIRDLARQIGRQQNPEDVDQVRRLLLDLPANDAWLAGVVLTSLQPPRESDLAQQLETGSWASARRTVLDQAYQVAFDAQAASPPRLRAIEAIRLGKVADVAPRLATLLSPAEELAVQIAALNTLMSSDSPIAAQTLITAWPKLSPKVRRQATDRLLTRRGWQTQLLDAIEEDLISTGDVDLARWKSLLRSDSEMLARLQRLTHGMTLSADRKKVLDDYQSVLQRPGDAPRGQVVFKQHCASCHKVGEVGYELGPNLAAMKNRGADAILMNVLMPNQEVNPQYLSYTATTSDGRVLSGMITSETATSITLRRDDQQVDTLLRVDLDELKSTGQSLMPEGLEKQIDQAAMADLLTYLMSLE